MLLQVDLAAALAALDLDPDDPDDADDVAVLHALVARRGLVRTRWHEEEARLSVSVSGPQIVRASRRYVGGPEVPWGR
jgi:hypothetical protein